MRFFKKIELGFFILLYGVSVSPALAYPDIYLDNPEEARTLRDFFATPYDNKVEPLNWEEFEKLYQIHGGPLNGKALLVIDIGEDGYITNLVVLQRNKDLKFGSRIERLFLERLKFIKGSAQKGVLFEVGFCGRILCKVHFERISGPEEPQIIGYEMPYLGLGQIKKKFCGDLVIGFDVNKYGIAKNLKITSSTIPGQYGLWLKDHFYDFKFEKKKPAKGIELLVRFEAMGRCEE